MGLVLGGELGLSFSSSQFSSVGATTEERRALERLRRSGVFAPAHAPFSVVTRWRCFSSSSVCVSKGKKEGRKCWLLGIDERESGHQTGLLNLNQSIKQDRQKKVHMKLRQYRKEGTLFLFPTMHTVFHTSQHHAEIIIRGLGR